MADDEAKAPEIETKDEGKEADAATGASATDNAPPAGGEEPFVDISFTILPEQFQHKLSLPPGATVADVAVALAQDLRIPEDALRISFAGDPLDDAGATLAGLGLQPGGSEVNTMEVSVVYDEGKDGGGGGPGGAGAGAGGMGVGGGGADSGGAGASEIEVTVNYDDRGVPPKKIRVQIVRDVQRKRYLGGYRNRKTSLLYHHASSQTEFDRRRPWEGQAEKNHRTTQTAVEKTRSCNTLREGGTQMAKPGLHLDNAADRVKVPGAYFSADQLLALKLEKTIIVQRYWRGFKARVRAHDVREALSERRRRVAEAAAKRAGEAESRHAKEIERRMHPRTFEDFEILYNELENWRQHETMRVNSSGMPEEQRLAALAQLLHKETKLLQTIDRLKISANKENRGLRIKKIMDLMAAPKKWQMSDGEVAEVHTPFTTRAKELLELYNGLSLPNLSIDERLDVLLHVKWTVKEFDCNLTREVVDLIDREADLLNRGRSEGSLDGLRKRIGNLFLQFCETPEFNPEAARFQKVPRDLAQRPNVRPIVS